MAPKAPWMDGRDYPLIGVGIGLEKLPDWTDDAEEWARLREAILAEEGAWLGPTNRGKIYRIVLSRPLSLVSADAETLDAQAEEAVEWATGALGELLSKGAGST